MLEQLIPNAKIRRLVIAAAATAGVLVMTQFVLPGAQGPARGTPAAILFSGLVLGLATSLFATGVVLVYRTMRFINFIQGPIGAAAAVVVTHMLVFTPVPFPIALVIGLLLAAGIGTLAGLFTLRFLNASRLFLTVATIVGSIFLLAGAITFIVRLPFWPAPDEISTAQQQDLAQLSDNLPFAGWEFHIGTFPEAFGFAHVFALELSVLALVGVGVFLRYTRAGMAVRAMAENPERASLLGIGVGGLTILVWTIAGALDGAGALAAATGAPGVGSGFAALLAPFAAAVLGRFRNLPTTIFASVLIGVAREAWGFSYQGQSQRFFALLFVVVTVALLLQRRGSERSESGAAVSWSATDESRPVPKEMADISALKIGRIVLIALSALVVLLLPLVVSEGRIEMLGLVIISTITVLSLVVLTGWTGQVSLGQFALVAVGALVGGSLSENVNIPFWFAVPIASAVTAGVAVFVGLPALRVKGLFLMVSTFAFAVGAQAVLFDENWFGWLMPEKVERPTLFFLDFESNKAMYYLLLVALALAITVVANLRKSRVGRLLIALRENEANVQALGVNPVRLKLLAMAIAGALAGYAGALMAHQQRAVNAELFTADASVNIFVAAVIGGVSSAGGALLGSTYIQLVQEFASGNPVLAALFGGVGPLLVLFMAPGGLISLVTAARDSVLRIVAQRRNIVVPSLFADFDPSILERRLIPMGEADARSGLGVVGTGRRFILRSELYKGRGERIVDRLSSAPPPEDAAAFAAAARRMEEQEDEDAQLALAATERFDEVPAEEMA